MILSKRGKLRCKNIRQIRLCTEEFNFSKNIVCFRSVVYSLA